MRNSIIVVGIILLISFAALVACQETQETETATEASQSSATPTTPVTAPAPTRAAATPLPTTAPADGPVRGGVLNMQAGDPSNWHPYEVRSTTALGVVSPLYNQLVQMNPDNMSEIGLDLAASWDVSDGGKVYTFKIREGIEWEPGQTFTADDVMFSLDEMAASGLSRAGLWVPYAESWEKVDGATVQITLKEPAAAFLGFFAIDYVKMLPKYRADIGFDDPLNTVGTGPFKFISYRKGDAYELERNPNYFKSDLPYVDTIKGFVIRDKAAYITAFKTDRVLMQHQPYPRVTAIEAKALAEDLGESHKFYPHFPGTHYQVQININESPFKDTRVRRALHLATDRNQYIQLFSDPDITKLGLPFPPGTWYGRSIEESNQVPGFRQPKDEDIAEAMRLLADAGFAEGFTTSVMTGPGKWADMAAVVKEQLKKIGVEVELDSRPSPDFRVAFSEQDFKLGVWGSGITINDPDAIISDSYRLGAFRNYPEWTNAKAEELAAKQRGIQDQVERARVLRELEDFLTSWEDNYWINLWWEPDLWLVSNKVGGFHGCCGAGHDFMKYDTVWIRQ
jgi:peptide/nickel transport system substrate-binding protein